MGSIYHCSAFNTWIKLFNSLSCLFTNFARNIFYNSIFINYLQDYFDEIRDKVKVGDSLISCLLFADDIVLLSNSAEGLQKLFDSLLLFFARNGIQKLMLTKQKL